MILSETCAKKCPPRTKGQAMALRGNHLALAAAFSAAVVVADGVGRSAYAQTSVRVLLDWKFEGPAAPFLVALDRGYFRAEGLDVTVEPGTSSIDAVQKTVAGAYEFGFGDINALLRAERNSSPPAKAIFMVYNKPPFAIVGRRSRGVTGPKDLEGRRLGAPAADSSFTHWPLFARLNAIDVSKVRIENVALQVREPMLAAGQVDAVTGFSFTVGVDLRARGVPADDIVVLLMADYGLTLYGNAIVVNQKFAAAKPDAVRGFLRAFVKGLQDTINNPERAIESVMRRNALASRDVELDRLRSAIRDSIVTPEVRSLGLGAIDPARLDAAIDQIGQVAGSRTKTTAADIFDPSFLPPAADRKAD
jgi:NitT/TauT family transport system substrate-binding protein